VKNVNKKKQQPICCLSRERLGEIVDNVRGKDQAEGGVIVPVAFIVQFW